MPDNGGLQLLPETRKKIEIHASGQSKLLVFSLLFIVLILGLYGSLVYYKKTLLEKLDGVEQNLVALEKSRNKENEEKLVKLQEKMAVIKPLITAHVFWSDGMSKFQSLINPRVQIDSLTAATSKKEFSLKAFADNYTSLARQISAFYNDGNVTDVILGKVSSLPTGRLEFSMQINFDANKLLKRNLPNVLRQAGNR